MVITQQHVHGRNWKECPRCEGGRLFTARDHKQGAICTSCGNKGEVPRFSARPVVDNASFYERMAGA